MLLDRLRSSRRARWWVSFVLLATLMGLWSLATPLFGSPDEPSHVIQAVGIERNQWLPSELPKGEQPLNPFAPVPNPGSLRLYSVRIPRVYGDAWNVSCFKFQPQATADCLKFSGANSIAREYLYTRGHPGYLVVVGLPTLVWHPGAGAVYLMRLVSVLLCAALISSALVALADKPSPMFALAGLAVAVTPMVLFLGAVVNPSSLEVAAALLLWVSVIELARGERLQARMVTRAGIAASVMCLMRPISPLWVILIVLVALSMVNRQRMRELCGDRRLRIWTIVVLVCAISQVAWVRASDQLKPVGSVAGAGKSQSLRDAMGSSFRLVQEMIGVFGWLDTRAPRGTLAVWLLTIGGIAVLAIALGGRRWSRAIAAVSGITVVAPVVLEVTALQQRGFAWQGRYTLPIAIGLPLVGGLALATSRRVRTLNLRPLLVTLGVLLAVGHVLAFSQALRRYTVGADGPIWYFLHPRWKPPLTALGLTLGYTIVITAWLTWLLAPSAYRHVDQINASTTTSGGGQSC